MKRFPGKIMLAVSLLFLLGGTASAEIIKGRVKSIAPEAKLVSLMVDQDKIRLISWDKATAWKGILSSADLKLDELLTFDCKQKKDAAVAVAVSRSKTPVPAGMKAITLDRLIDNLSGLAGSRPMTLIDTRPVELYDAGHIPGAVSVPLSRLEKKTFGLLPEGKGSKLVFYDQGQGGDSAGKGAEISAKYGYEDVAVFQDGVSGWTGSGRFLASSTAFIHKIHPAVIDVSPTELVLQAHIEKAVSFPANRLKEFFNEFPEEKFAPIVVYGDSDKVAVAAAETIRSWGYRRVTVYPGGVIAWVKNAEVPVTGPAEQQITSPVGSHGGKLSTNDFEMALISPNAVAIVDVRPAAEQKKGSFPNAKKLPLQELMQRHGELDREMIQVVFAADAERASMAYDFLKSKEYRVNYLNGSVTFEKNGKYQLKKE